MSKKINVNPGRYKERGRQRQGEEIVHGRERARLAKAEERVSPARTARAQANARTRPPRRRH